MKSRDDNSLVDDILQYLKNERDLYGDFNVSISDSDKNRSGGIDPKNQEEAITKQDKPSQTSSHSKDEQLMESQEKLFNDSPHRQIYYDINKCKTLEELEKLCEEADVLHTDLENTNLVFGVGNPQADLMLIGEAPGAEEDKQGEPFVGAAGKLLNKILAAINFDREDIYIANILKHRPPNNRNPKPEERKKSLPFLLRQIDLIEPKLILCLGKVAAQTLLDNNQSLSSMRGTFHDFRGKYKLMATYHPAALLRHAKWKRPTWEDVKLLRNKYDELGGEPK